MVKPQTIVSCPSWDVSHLFVWHTCVPYVTLQSRTCYQTSLWYYRLALTLLLFYLRMSHLQEDMLKRSYKGPKKRKGSVQVEGDCCLKL